MNDNVYETERALSEYLLFHYGRKADLMPWKSGPHEALQYPLTCALLLLTAPSLFAENGTGDTLARFEVKSRLGTVPVGTAPSHPRDPC